MRSLILAGLIVGSTASAGLAQMLPSYDVEAYCRQKQASDLPGPHGYMAQECFKTEQGVYNIILKKWPATPEKIRALCESKARVSDLKYTMLDACLDQEDQKSKSNVIDGLR